MDTSITHIVHHSLLSGFYRSRMARTGRVGHVFHGSSRVDRAWYTPDSRVVEILFPDDARVLYFDVPPREWEAFIEAPSAGRFLREQLERHSYRRR